MSAAFRLSPARLLAVLAAGALFGFGLSLSTMVQPEVVLGFLRFQDAGLMLVMGGAMGVTLVAYKLLPRVLKKPLLGGYFHWHVSHWNRDTLVGAAIFGIGWGLCGVCPGPAIAGLGTGNWDLLWALAGIALGAGAQGLLAPAPKPPAQPSVGNP
ncbi:MAG: DUF6691 family protein [Burkholderiaceae bacterium]